MERSFLISDYYWYKRLTGFRCVVYHNIPMVVERRYSETSFWENSLSTKKFMKISISVEYRLRERQY